MARISYNDLSPRDKRAFDIMIGYPISLAPYPGTVYLATNKDALFLLLKRAYKNDPRPYIAEEVARELVNSQTKVKALDAPGYRGHYLVYLDTSTNYDFKVDVVCGKLAWTMSCVLNTLFPSIGYHLNVNNGEPYSYKLQQLIEEGLNNFLNQTDITMVSLPDVIVNNFDTVGYTTSSYYSMAYNRMLENKSVNVNDEGWSATTWLSI